MNSIKLPKTIKIGGFDHSIIMDGEDCDNSGAWGLYSFRRKTITLDSGLTPQHLSCEFIHELLHGVDQVYNGASLSEDTVKAMANGLHQVFEQLGVRFVL
uniref:Peptidase n=1 Tax=viral metagenome TaxID=1070528 RepID=A0A6M3IG10_9ZZZZ